MGQRKKSRKGVRKNGIQVSGGRRRGDMVAHGVQILGTSIHLIQNIKRKQMRRITEKLGTD